MTQRPRLAVTGSTGLVGKALCRAAAAAGWDVVRLVRTAKGEPGTATWDPATGAIDARALGPIDAVVHLAGENVAGGRWTTARKAAIADSRGPATEKLCRALAALPHVLVKQRPICVGVIDVSIGDQQKILLPSRTQRITVHLHGERTWLMLDDGRAHASLIALICVALLPLPFVTVAALSSSALDPTLVAA
jgi:hypothetical protein